MPQAGPIFDLINPDAAGPVVVSVPHAGRDYAAAHRAMLRVPPERLNGLEDRWVDLLVSDLADTPALIARTPRAWIDLNRHEAELDSGLVEGLVTSRLMTTAKVRGGLGLIPRRLAGAGELWRGRLTRADVEARIATIHRPYHLELKRLLDQALAREGVAVLLDLHSMPPLQRNAGGPPPARVVIGNRFGQSAAPWATASLAATCARFDLSWTENAPYAGGYIVERHGRPAAAVHAVQLEIDRSLYLDPRLSGPVPAGVERMRRFVRAAVADLAQAAADTQLPLAAE